jgi:hypothetical protein
MREERIKPLEQLTLGELLYIFLNAEIYADP